MKPAISPFVAAAISAALVLAAFTTSALAQRSTTVTEQTVTERTVTRSSTQPTGGVDASAPGHSTIVAEEGNTVVEKHGNTTTELEFKPAASAHDLNVPMLRDFESVKAGDPNLGAEIAKDPALVQDAGFVREHPSLQAFLEKYPDARQEIVSSPGNFVTPVAGSKWNSHEAAGIPRD